MGEAIERAKNNPILAVIAFVGTVATWASVRFTDPRPLGAADVAHVVAMLASSLLGSMAGGSRA